MFEPLRAIDALNDHGVDYVVVGGWGALQQGATRLTQDVDISPDLSAANLDRLGKALESLHAELSIGPGETVPAPIIDGRLLSQMQIGNWDTDAGGVDVLHEIPATTGSVGYAQLRQNAAEVTVQGRTFLVASLADITASKQAAGRPKDLEALPELQRLLDDPEARARDAKRLSDLANTQPCSPHPEEKHGAGSQPHGRTSSSEARGRSR